MAGLGFDPTTYYNQQYVENQETRPVSGSPGQARKAVKLEDSSGSEISLPSLGSAIISGTKTVTTAGTPVQVSAASVPIKGVWVNADLLAGTVVTVGDSSVVGNASGMKGIILTPGNPPIFLAITNLNLLWVDAQANGGKLAYAYLT